MEAAGLAVGVVALAGLCSQCLEAFDLLDTAKHFSIEYEISVVKLDIEKTRLLQGADGLDLLAADQRDQTPAIRSPPMQQQLERILLVLRHLLTESESLTVKYGLTQEGVNQRKSSTNVTCISSTRTHFFEAAYSRYQQRLGSKQKQTSFFAKTNRAIKDKDSFRELITHIHDLVTGLNDLFLVPAQFQRLTAKEDVVTLGDDLARLRVTHLACFGQDNALSEQSSLRVAQSQQATHDFRTIDEWLDDTASMQYDEEEERKSRIIREGQFLNARQEPAQENRAWHLNQHSRLNYMRSPRYSTEKMVGIMRQLGENGLFENLDWSDTGPEQRDMISERKAEEYRTRSEGQALINRVERLHGEAAVGAFYECSEAGSASESEFERDTD